MKTNWLIPFKGRNHSGAYTQNFLWQQGSIYIMDNHRAALWCWLQHIKKNEKYSLFHIDRHYDTLNSRMKEWLGVLPDLSNFSINDYLDLKYLCEGTEANIIRFDNYLSIFLRIYKDQIDECLFATHLEGDKPKFKKFQDIAFWLLPHNLERWIDESSFKWIFNLDLDFFFYDHYVSDFDCDQRIMFSDDYISNIFEAISNLYHKGKILTLTVALSPEFTKDWETAEILCEKLCKKLKINFKLPDD